eukprot:scaffold1921_cov384-Pinguiococcus_pyrenoidosus.AAC.5
MAEGTARPSMISSKHDLQGLFPPAASPHSDTASLQESHPPLKILQETERKQDRNLHVQQDAPASALWTLDASFCANHW